MELFTLLCETCAAKLKVTQTNAVGQVLACPKCGNMVKVLPPPGWQPTPELKNSFSAEDLAKVGSFATSSTSSSFEEIDEILSTPAKKSASKSPVARQTSKPKIPAPRAQLKNRQASNPAESAAPILPTAQWTPAQSHQRRKWLLIGISVLGTLVILGSIVGAILINRESTPVVLNDDGEEAAGSSDTSEPPIEQPLIEPVIPDSTAPEIDTAEPPPDQPNSESPDPPDEKTGQENPVETITDNPPEIPGLDAKPKLPENPLVANSTEPTKVAPVDELINRDVFGNRYDEDSKLGGLSSLLNQSNTSIREIQDLAESVRDTETIGIARYYVAKPDPLEESIDTEKQLGLSCGGILYENLPVLAMLRDVTAITGVPFSLDAASFQAANFDFGVTVNIKMEQSEDLPLSFAVAVDSILAPLNVKQTTTPLGCVLIRPLNADQKTTTTYPLPTFATQPDVAPKMVDFLKRMIAPESWTATDDPATAELGANELTIYQTPIIQRQLKDFLDKLTFVSEFQGTPAELTEQAELKTRWTSAQELLGKPLELGRTFDVPLESLCTSIQQKSGLTVLIDWPSIMQEGWTPATMVPGNINETTVYRTLKEIARSMKITMRAIDANTVELTTYQSATSQVELEVFYYGDIIEETFTEEHVSDIVTRTLSREFSSNPNIRMDFVPQLKCIVAVAPQSLQKQLEIVIERLRKL